MDRYIAKNGYTALAKVYDELMYDIDYAEWAEYISGLCGNGCRKIIEYACGTGNITLELVKKGFEVTAVDISQEMLNAASEKLRKNAVSANIVCADMASLKLNKAGDCAVCACDGVNYILDDIKLRDFFSNVYGNLRPGGRFLFDISSEYKISAVLGDEFFYDDGDNQTVFWQNSYNKAEKIVDMELNLFLREGDVYKRYDELHRQRAWSAGEIIRMLEQEGFSEIEFYAFGTTDAPAAEDERIQFKAERK